MPLSADKFIRRFRSAFCRVGSTAFATTGSLGIDSPLVVRARQTFPLQGSCPEVAGDAPISVSGVYMISVKPLPEVPFSPAIKDTS
jgi:hypothetical protein